MNAFAELLRREVRRERVPLMRAALLGATVAAATVTLLGLSGWFITAAATAGLAGSAATLAFNYLLPSAAIRLLAIMRTGARYGERLAGHAAAFAVLARVRPALYRAITASPPAAALALTTGEASARLVQDVGAIEMAIARRPARAGAIAAIVAGGVLVLAARPTAAVILITLIAAAISATVSMCRRVEGAGRDIHRCQGLLREELSAQLAAAPELRCYGMEEIAVARLAEIDVALSTARRRQAVLNGAIEGVGALTTGLAAIGVFVACMPKGAPLAALAALTAAATIDCLMPALKDFAARASTREAELRLEALFAAHPQPFPKPCDAALSLPGLSPLGPGGTRIAVTGPSGTGKTSLVEALIGLRDSSTMDVRLGAFPLSNLPTGTLRSLFAWSPQDAQLIAGTVRDNLMLADPGASDEVMWRVLDDACLADVVSALPHGLDTWVGENGERLSGGERRRLSLARAYLSSAPWLLLDEPTEALDPETEQLLVRRLCSRLDRTNQGMIAVTHREAVCAICNAEMRTTNEGIGRYRLRVCRIIDREPARAHPSS